jgi:hypothetical protein
MKTEVKAGRIGAGVNFLLALVPALELVEAPTFVILQDDIAEMCTKPPVERIQRRRIVAVNSPPRRRRKP